MPIWKSSELASGRAGSASCRRNSRSLPVDGPLHEGATPSQSQTDKSSFLDAGFSLDGASVTGVAALPGALTPRTAMRFQSDALEPEELAGSFEQSQQTLLRPVSSMRRGSSGNVFGVAPQPTYTVQYVGIANGELGILSQKQRLGPQAHRPVRSATASGGVIPPTAPGRRATVAATGPSGPSSSRLPTAVSVSAVAATAAAASAGGTSAQRPPSSVSTPMGRVPINVPQAPVSPHSRPTSSQSGPPSRSASASLRPGATLSSTLSGPPSRAASASARQGATPSHTLSPQPSVPSTEASGPTPLAPAPPPPGAGFAAVPTLLPLGPPAELRPASLASLVEDATGQVKVVSECFYSRPLHSRAGPRDRHTRQNRPMGPPAQDMDPLSTGLPGCFASRAPSAGGFPGWKLTTGAPGALGAGARGAGGFERSGSSGSGGAGGGAGQAGLLRGGQG